MFSRFSRGSMQPPQTDDGRTEQSYPQGTAASGRQTSHSDYPAFKSGAHAPNPSHIRLLRFFLYCLSSASALATAGVAIAIIAYYNNNSPSIKPAWGTVIATVVIGIISPGPFFGTMIITPYLFRRYGNFLAIVNQVRIDLLLQISFAIIWVSVALAVASDLRGYENCLWDGYYHWPKPADFQHVCDLRNALVAMAYTTFGLYTLQWFLLTSIAGYILLYLDQEVLSELTNDMGGRAYRAHKFAIAQYQDRRDRHYAEKGGDPEKAERRLSRPSSNRRPSNTSRRSENPFTDDQEIPASRRAPSAPSSQPDH